MRAARLLLIPMKKNFVERIPVAAIREYVSRAAVVRSATAGGFATTANSCLYRSLTIVAEREAFGSNFDASRVTVKQTLVPRD